MAAKKPKNDALRFQQVEAGKQALGAYAPALNWLMQNAGLGSLPSAAPAPMPAMPQAPQMPSSGFGTANRMQQAAQPSPVSQLAGMPMASTQPVGGAPQSPYSPAGNPAATPGLPNSQLGIFGQGQDALRLQQAEEDVGRLADQRANMLRYRLGQQGIGNSGTAASAFAQNERSALSDLAGFRRNLAINAGTEQERRVQQVLAALGIGQGIGAQGQQVSGMYKQLDAQKPGLLGSLAPFASMFSFAPIPLGGSGGKK